MRIAVITLRYSPTLGAFDTAPLSDFTKDRSLLAMNEHFFRVDGVPHLACVIRYQEATVPRAAPPPANGASSASGAHRRRDRDDNRPDPFEGTRSRSVIPMPERSPPRRFAAGSCTTP